MVNKHKPTLRTLSSGRIIPRVTIGRNEWSYPSQMGAKSTTTNNHPSTPPSNKM